MKSNTLFLNNNWSMFAVSDDFVTENGFSPRRICEIENFAPLYKNITIPVCFEEILHDNGVEGDP